MLLPALAVTVALVVPAETQLKAAPKDNAPRQATLAPGDWLEVRGERQGYLQVYDHRRERPGYVRPSSVRTYAVDESATPRLGAIVEYLRDAPGEESLGVGYVALFLRAAPPAAVGPELFDALGTMAERLARRASARTERRGDGALAAQVEAAESYGVRFARFEREGRTRVCYDGEAYRRVLALPTATAAQRVRAAMGLTDPTCTDPSVGQSAALELARWRAGVADGIDLAVAGPEVKAHERARFRARRAAVRAELAYFAARGGDAELARRAAEGAKEELLRVERAALADEDRLAFDEAALRVASVRWANEATPSPGGARALEVTFAPGEPGQTCVRLARKGAPASVLAEHCTYSFVWPQSLRVAPREAAVTLVAQPLVGWSELVVLRPNAEGKWTADTVAPATVDPDLGYVELAGFTPDGSRLLLVREARASGPLGSPSTLAPWVQRSFQVVAAADLRVEKQATSPGPLAAFARFQTPDWRRGTLALR